MLKWLKSFFAEPVRERGLVRVNLGDGKGHYSPAAVEVTIMERAGDMAKVWYHPLGDPLAGRYLNHSNMSVRFGEWLPLDEIEMVGSGGSGAP